MWLWRQEQIEIHLPHDDGYRRVERSDALPDLDLALLVSCLDHPTAVQAVRAFRDALA